MNGLFLYDFSAQNVHHVMKVIKHCNRARNQDLYNGKRKPIKTIAEQKFCNGAIRCF